jgi:hypothetical protein
MSLLSLGAREDNCRPCGPAECPRIVDFPDGVIATNRVQSASPLTVTATGSVRPKDSPGFRKDRSIDWIPPQLGHWPAGGVRLEWPGLPPWRPTKIPRFRISESAAGFLVMRLYSKSLQLDKKI